MENQQRQSTYQDRVGKVYNARNNHELAKSYDLWADEYDSDMTTLGRDEAEEDSVELFLKTVPAKASILDAGAGTGIYGQIVHDHGYHDLVAIDISKGMLEVSKEKGVYKNLYEMTLGEKLDFPTNSFDAVMSFGVFTTAHAPSHAFDELIRVTKPGGHIVFTMRLNFYEQSDAREKIESLESSGAWALVDQTQPYQPYPEDVTDTSFKAWAYRTA